MPICGISAPSTHIAALYDMFFKNEIKRIYDGVDAETRKSQASFQIIRLIRGSAEDETRII